MEACEHKNNYLLCLFKYYCKKLGGEGTCILNMIKIFEVGCSKRLKFELPCLSYFLLPCLWTVIKGLHFYQYKSQANRKRSTISISPSSWYRFILICSQAMTYFCIEGVPDGGYSHCQQGEVLEGW